MYVYVIMYAYIYTNVFVYVCAIHRKAFPDMPKILAKPPS